MGEAKRRQQLDPSYGKRKIIIEHEGISVIRNINNLDDIFIYYNPAKHKIVTTLLTWKEVMDMLDKNQNITTEQKIHDFTEEDLKTNCAFVLAIPL